MVLVIGIDPGKKGGISRIDTEEPSRPVQAVPLFYNTKTKELDVHACMDFLEAVEPTLIIIEHQQARPMQGKSGAIMMKDYGGLLACCRLSSPLKGVIEVKPRDWQKVIIPNALPKQSKQASIEHVLQCYPEVTVPQTPRSKVYHDGVTDSVCLAEYGVRMLLPGFNPIDL